MGQPVGPYTPATSMQLTGRLQKQRSVMTATTLSDRLAYKDVTEELQQPVHVSLNHGCCHGVARAITSE